MVGNPPIYFLKTFFFINQKFSIQKYTHSDELFSPEAIAYTEKIAGKTYWLFSTTASKKIMFEIFKNKKASVNLLEKS